MSIVIGWLVIPVIFIIFLSGFKGSSWLPGVNTTAWGGLLVTFLLAVGSILLSFPIGVLLALGRRSELPVVKVFSTVFIEAVRGVPLITILFMFSIILALFLPQETRLDRLLRALIALTVFSAAYTAENVRGGLQGVPQGQVRSRQSPGNERFTNHDFHRTATGNPCGDPGHGRPIHFYVQGHHPGGDRVASTTSWESGRPSSIQALNSYNFSSKCTFLLPWFIGSSVI